MRGLRLSLTIAAFGAAALSGCGAPVWAPSGPPAALKAPAARTEQGRAPGALGGLFPRVEAHAPEELDLHVLPGPGAGALKAAIAQAKRSIRLQMYMLTERETIAALVGAAKRGVAVRVLLEPEPFNPNNPNKPLTVNQAAAKTLAAAGVSVRWTSKAFVFTHAKCLILDEREAWISTANFTHSGLNTSREYLVADRAPSDVAELVRVFEGDWRGEPYRPSDEDLLVSPVNAREKLMGLVAGAGRELFLAAEVAGDPALTNLLASEIKQGVRVRALLGDHENRVPVLVVAQAWMAVGAEVRLQSRPYLHAKSILADGELAYVGSINLTANSMDNNREIGLLTRTPQALQALSATLEQDWAAARVLTREEIERAGNL